MLLDSGSITEVVESTVSAMLAIKPDDAMFVRSWWPHSACDVAAIVISQLLLDRGDCSWRVVTAESEIRRAAHTWLERRNGSGHVEFSIDVTLHQFAWITDKPFCGAGKALPDSTSPESRTTTRQRAFRGSARRTRCI